MFIAEMMTKDGDWIEVEAKNMTDDDKGKTYRCCACRARAHFKNGPIKGKHFASKHHKIDCPIGTKGKIFRDPDGVEFKLKDVLNHQDTPIVEGPDDPDDNGNEGGGRKDLGPQGEPEDGITLHDPKKLSACSTIYREVFNQRSDDFIYEDMKVKDLLVDDRNIMDARFYGLDGIKMIVCHRFPASKMDMSNKLKKDLLRDGYVFLRDAYTSNDKNAIYIAVKMQEATHDKKFRQQLYGDKARGLERDPRKCVVVMGRVQRLEDPFCTLYKMQPLSSARVCFTDRRSHGEGR